MRVLFSALASHGHLYPLVPLARSLADQGHEVLFATGAEFHPLLRDVGLVPLAAGIPLGQAFMSVRADLETGSMSGPASGPRPPIDPTTRAGDLPPEQTAAMARRVFGDVLPRAFFPDLVAIIDEHAPDLVVAELANPGAVLAAQARAVPFVVHGFGLVDVQFRSTQPENLALLANDFGVELPSGPPQRIQPIIDICPPSLKASADPALTTAPGAPGAPRAPIMPTGERRVLPLRPVALRAPGPGPDLSWRASPSRPLVYLTMGTAFGSTGVLREAIAGLGTLPVDVLVATGPTVDPDGLSDLPGNVRVERWVQQADVLAAATVVVHHGGSGTTLGATAAGALQLFLPQGADQFHNAEVLLGTGAAARIQRDDLTPASVVGAVSGLLAGADYRRAADRLAAEVAAMPSPEELAGQLPALAAELRSA